MAEPKNKPFPDLRVEPGALQAPIEAMDRIARVVSNVLSHRVAAGARLGVALSGGRDSVVLLYVLRQLVLSNTISVTLSAMHVHHGLSAKADAWADFCVGLCARLAVPLQVVRVDVARTGGAGPEASARLARYTAFADGETEWLALAHHRDDQAETVLLNLLRGAGVAGGAGMPQVRPQGKGPALIRPLLDVPRKLIEDCASELGLPWVEDDSNKDTYFRRNFLRTEILPRLDEKFPGGRQSLARSAAHFAECRHLLADLAALDRDAALAPSGRVTVSAINMLSASRARNLLRFLWGEAGFRAPDTRWVDEALNQLATIGVSPDIRLSTADGELRVYRGELYILPLDQQTSEASVIWDGETVMPWGRGRIRFQKVTGMGIRRDLFCPGAACIRLRQGGERLQPDVKRPCRSLRNLLQESAVPPWERARLPYLWIRDQLVWVGGIGCDAAWQAGRDQPGILPEYDQYSI